MGAMRAMGAATGKTRRIDTDVLIVGGGLIGATAACALAQGGLGVVVVERHDPARALSPGFDGRASSIALGSKRLLAAIGIWDGLAEDATPIEDIRVVDGESPLFLHYDHREAGDQPFGYMVENRVIREAQAARLAALDGVRLLAPAGVAAVERSPAGVEAVLEDGRTIGARLLIAADGRDSTTRDNAGIRITQWAYRQTGIVCTVEHSLPHRRIAHEHFFPAGPFAILPLKGKRSAVVWTERPDMAKALMAMDEDAFMEELGRRFGDHLGALRLVSPRWSHPLSLQFAETTIGRRLALLGDAAHAMHPIAGQGLNMGLRDVAALAEVLVDAKRLGLELGDPGVLARYQRWRRFDNTLMLAATDGLNRLFSNRSRTLGLARDLGLAAVNRIKPLKKFFMLDAMGLAGDLPRLMRGEML